MTPKIHRRSISNRYDRVKFDWLSDLKQVRDDWSTRNRSSMGVVLKLTAISGFTGSGGIRSP